MASFVLRYFQTSIPDWVFPTAENQRSRGVAVVPFPTHLLASLHPHFVPVLERQLFAPPPPATSSVLV